MARFLQSSTPSHSGREDKPPEAQQNSQNSQHVADVAHAVGNSLPLLEDANIHHEEKEKTSMVESMDWNADLAVAVEDALHLQSVQRP
mmetsp:Transcript_68551/g.150822  ORF Transcript_68551/g.150822 Transcript_68551/m.150822 type:complete len:88 (+) Transcript_68551:1086-1349(+)